MQVVACGVRYAVMGNMVYSLRCSSWHVVFVKMPRHTVKIAQITCNSNPHLPGPLSKSIAFSGEPGKCRAAPHCHRPTGYNCPHGLQRVLQLRGTTLRLQASLVAAAPPPAASAPPRPPARRPTSAPCAPPLTTHVPHRTPTAPPPPAGADRCLQQWVVLGC